MTPPITYAESRNPSAVAAQGPVGVTPLRQARTRARRADASPADLEQARRVLADKCDVIRSPRFDEPDAYAQLFEQSPALGTADTSWYTPVMSKLDVANTVVTPTGNSLLDARSEQLIFLRYNYCRLQVRLIKDRLADGLPSAQDAREVLAWHKRAMELRHQIAEWNLALVLAMAKRVRVPAMSFSDLVSEGNLALLRAVDKFDAGRGFKFSTYACRAILKCFSRLGTRSSKIQGLINVEFDPKLERSDYQETRRVEHESDCAQALKEIFLSNKAQLSDIERAVLEHRFSIGARAGATESMPTLQEVGQMVGLTKERVRQIQNKAMVKLRETLERDYL